MKPKRFHLGMILLLAPALLQSLHVLMSDLIRQPSVVALIRRSIWIIVYTMLVAWSPTQKKGVPFLLRGCLVR
jgi:hypothetical protein